MPNETIVQYILNVDTGKAEKGLKDTSRASKQTEQSFDKVGQATTQMNAKLKQTEQQAKRTGRGFKNLRRAGRDLDGAFADLGQGIGLVSPAAGNLFMTLSNGASIAEGLGRVMVGFLNPAMLGVVAVMATAGAAFAIYNSKQEAAAARAKMLEQATKDVTEAIKQQDKVLNKSDSSFGSFISAINEADAQLRLLRGEISKADFAELKAIGQATRTGEALKSSITTTISELQKLNIESASQIVRITDQLSKIEEAGKKEKKQLFDRRAQLESLIAQNKVLINDEERKLRNLDTEIGKYSDILTEIAKIENKEKERSKTVKDTNKALTQQQSAAKKLQGIINKLTIGELTGREKILAQYEQELAVIEKLGETSDDLFVAAEAETLLREKRDRLLDEELRKEQKKLAIIKEQGKEAISLIASTVQALRSPEAFVSSLGGIVGQVGEVFGSAEATTAGRAISTAAPAVTAIAGFGSLIQKAIDESDVSLDENQARRVVLGNMNEAFQNFSRDFERGLELLPETIVRVLPEFIVSLGKVLTVDLARVIAVDLPVAILRASPEIIIAIINEVAFLLADLVNGFKLALDQFTSFIQSMFTREGRRDAVASSIDGLKRVLETRFDGVGALRESVSAFAGGGSFIPQAAGGMRYTGNQRSGLAMLHQGEFVVPQSGMRPQSVDRQMSRSGGSPINIVINSPVVEQNAVDALVRRIEERFNSNFGLASSNLFGGR